MHLGFGEVEPVDRRDSLIVARDKFLARIKESAPQVLESLSKEPLDCFQRDRSDVAAVGGELSRWAQRWNLDAPWVIAVGHKTLVMWGAFIEAVRAYPEGYRTWSMVGDSRRYQSLSVPKPIDLLYEWVAENETRKRYLTYAKRKLRKYIEYDPVFSCLSRKIKRAVLEDFMGKVNCYCDEVLEAYLSRRDAAGEALWKLADSKEDFERNIEWTVNFQVLGESFNQVAKANGVVASTVERAVESTLAIIDLNKRAVATGRPKGAKDSFESSRSMQKRSDLLN